MSGWDVIRPLRSLDILMLIGLVIEWIKVQPQSIVPSLEAILLLRRARSISLCLVNEKAFN